MSGRGFKQGHPARIPLRSIATVGLDICLEDLEQALKLWRFEIRQFCLTRARLCCLEACRELTKKPGALLFDLLWVGEG